MKKQGRAERTGPAAQEAHRVYETPDDPAILNQGGTARVTAAEGWGLVIPVLRQAGMTLDRAREALIGRLAGRFTWMQAAHEIKPSLLFCIIENDIELDLRLERPSRNPGGDSRGWTSDQAAACGLLSDTMTCSPCGLPS